MVEKKSTLGFHGINNEIFATVKPDPVTFLELHPAQWGTLERVLAVFRSGREEDFDAAEIGLEDDPESKFGLTVTDETLSGKNGACFHEKGGEHRPFPGEGGSCFRRGTERMAREEGEDEP